MAMEEDMIGQMTFKAMHLKDFCPKIGKSTRDMGDDVDDRGHGGPSHKSN